MSKFTKQIEIRMSKDNSVYNTFVCHDGVDMATIPCETEWADEIAMRIISHEILFNKLVECSRELNQLILKHNKMASEKLNFDIVNECICVLDRCK